jgi:hypothetical protein
MSERRRSWSDIARVLLPKLSEVGSRVEPWWCLAKRVADDYNDRPAWYWDRFYSQHKEGYGTAVLA